MRSATIQRRLSTLEHRPRRRRTSRTLLNLDCFTDVELEELAVLAEKYEAMGAATDWTEAEVAALQRLARVERERCRSSN